MDFIISTNQVGFLVAVSSADGCVLLNNKVIDLFLAIRIAENLQTNFIDPVSRVDYPIPIYY